MSNDNLSVGVGVLGATGYIGEPYRAETVSYTHLTLPTKA